MSMESFLKQLNQGYSYAVASARETAEKMNRLDLIPEICEKTYQAIRREKEDLPETPSNEEMFHTFLDFGDSRFTKLAVYIAREIGDQKLEDMAHESILSFYMEYDHLNRLAMPYAEQNKKMDILERVKKENLPKSKKHSSRNYADSDEVDLKNIEQLFEGSKKKPHESRKHSSRKYARHEKNDSFIDSMVELITYAASDEVDLKDLEQVFEKPNLDLLASFEKDLQNESLDICSKVEECETLLRNTGYNMGSAVEIATIAFYLDDADLIKKAEEGIINYFKKIGFLTTVAARLKTGSDLKQAEDYIQDAKDQSKILQDKYNKL